MKSNRARANALVEKARTMHEEQQDLAEIGRVLDEACRLDPKALKYEDWSLLGLFRFQEEEDFPGAWEALRRAVDSDGSDSAGWGVAPLLLPLALLLGELEEGKRLLARAVALCPTDSRASLVEAFRNLEPLVTQASEGMSLLSAAAVVGPEELVAALLDSGIPVDSRDQNDGWTALFAAVTSNRPAMARLLLERGADPEARSHEGMTPMMMAKGIEVAELLIASGADVNARDEKDGTALFHAAVGHRPDMVEFLISRGADVNVPGPMGFAPLIAAFAPPRRPVETVAMVETVEALLAAGADREATAMGATAMQWAEEAGYETIAELLTDR